MSDVNSLQTPLEEGGADSRELDLDFKDYAGHITLKSIESVLYQNNTQTDREYEWLGNFFRLRRGSLQVELILSDKIKLPPQSELVSCLYLVTPSPGAEVTMGISHCAKLTPQTISKISMVSATLDTSPVKLSHNMEASFSCSSEHGALKLPVTGAYSYSRYILAVIKKCETMPPAATGLLSSLRPSYSLLCGCRYRYVVFYQLPPQVLETNLMHWKVHVVSFKDTCELNVSFV